jgi:hypothetical protein
MRLQTGIAFDTRAPRFDGSYDHGRRFRISATHCETAAQLVACLELSEPVWDAAGRWGWCFRGQDCDQPLIPSALRESVSWPIEIPLALPKALHEFYAVVVFLRAADRSGLAIPHDAPELRAYPFQAAFGADFSMDVLLRWPSEQIASVVALAQHYGIPTRLLDWTFRPLVAAYFAAYGLAKEACDETRRTRYDASKNMVVWALNLRAIPPSVPGRADGVSRFAVVEAPQATNPNLAAQAGLFTLDREVDREPDGRRALEELLPAMLRQSGTRRQLTSDPLFRKFTLPHTEARRLLRLVGLRGVTAAAVSPGHKGVADSLYEELIWEK